MKLIITTLLSGLFTFLFLFTSDASAYLKFCNKSSKRNVYVAVATREFNGVKSEGWWTIKRGKCKTPIGKKLSKRNSYFYYADTDGRTKWTGDYPFCTRPRKFTLRGQLKAKPNGAPLKCRTRGTKLNWFREIETAKKNFTQNLID